MNPKRVDEHYGPGDKKYIHSEIFHRRESHFYLGLVGVFRCRICELTVNGEKHEGNIDASSRLIDLLREEFGLVSVREGCGVGECGACTVLLDGEPVCSCLVPAVQARGRSIVTVEGLELNGELDTIQKTFLAADAVQCGFCTPGMILTAKALLMKNPHPSREDIRLALAGNLCRCTGYQPIINAVEVAAGGED